METTFNIFKTLVILLFLATLVFIALKLKSIEETKQKQLDEYQHVIKLLEAYKPMSVSTTLMTDDQFMSVLIKKLSSDSEFLAAVAKTVKNIK